MLTDQATSTERATSTEQATAKLADIFRTGDADTKVDRVAEGNLWEAARHAGEGNRAGADYHLEEAYRALGAEPPDATADDWVQERHPVQIEADRRCQEESEGEWGSPARAASTSRRPDAVPPTRAKLMARKRQPPSGKKPKPRPKSTPPAGPDTYWRDVTRSQVQQLAAAGDDGLTPRAVVHEACFPSKAATLKFVDRITSEGFGGERGKIDEKQHPPLPYGATFARVDAVNLEAIEPLVMHLVAVAAESRGLYAGWGCRPQMPA
jgi:hypothetical protein